MRYTLDRIPQASETWQERDPSAANVEQPPAKVSMDVDYQRWVLLYLPDGRAVVRRAGFGDANNQDT